ncbi:MAG TPA: NADH-quinone oxidoreductase subunit NuoH [Longimicrobiales bacterium]|nr:NADH-quinone oxidoreductase subunit NuoH [Longimicrobiales bacterium]
MNQVLHDVGALSPTAFVLVSITKVGTAFTVVLLTVAMLTLMERKVSAWIQDRLGPNRVGPGGLLQPIADGIKNLLKEETYPAEASRAYFLLAPAITIIPALVLFAVIPFASPLPTPWGLVDPIIADVSIGVLFVLALSSLGVYGIVMAGWSSNSKYAFLGGMRASAQMVSYEIGLGMSLVPVFMLTGDVTLTETIWVQQEGLGLWFAFPLSVAFFLFIVSAFAETNRLPFDLPEAESELVTGYHTEYSSMKFSMFFIAEYAHVLTVSALMATLFLGGWDIPFWQGDDMRVVGPGLVMGAEPAWWKTLLTFAAFTAKTLFFVFMFMWVRWTVPRFRYDQVMDLGWKVVLEAITVFILLVGAEILVLDAIGLPYGFLYGLILTVTNFGALALLLFVLDRNRIIGGAYRRPVKRVPVGERIDGRPKEHESPVEAGVE